MNEKWIRDTGLVFSLVFLVLGVWKHLPVFLFASMGILALLLFYPPALTPLALVWLKVAEVLGYVMNKVFFGVVFFLVVLPIGLLRRLLQGDLRSLEGQKGEDSAFINRGVVVSPADLLKPF